MTLLLSSKHDVTSSSVVLVLESLILVTDDKSLFENQEDL